MNGFIAAWLAVMAGLALRQRWVSQREQAAGPRLDGLPPEAVEALRAAHDGAIESSSGARRLIVMRRSIPITIGAVRAPGRVALVARGPWALPPGPTFSLDHRNGLDVHPDRRLSPRLDERFRGTSIDRDLARALVAREDALLRIDQLESSAQWIEARVAYRDVGSIGPGLDVVAGLAAMGTEPLADIAARAFATLARDAKGPFVELGSDAGAVRIRGVASVEAHLAGAGDLSASIACDREGATDIGADPRAADAAAHAGGFELAHHGSELRIAWKATPSSEELDAGIELLAALASRVPRRGVFR